MDEYRLVRLKNGTYSVHSVAHGETFHPVVGPVIEAEALYVQQLCLPARIAANADRFVIWDVGLGAAANVLTVLRAARHIPATVQIVSFDCTLEPLKFAIQNADCLKYLSGYESHLANLTVGQSAHFRNDRLQVDWTIHHCDFPALLEDSLEISLPVPHAILFDAFSPAKNPAMWSYSVFSRLFQRLRPNIPCALATYSRSTLLRVTLLLAGFFVGSGRATGEKEETTIAANARELIESPLDRSWLKRARNSTSAEPLWDSSYRQQQLSEKTLERLLSHPQFL